MSECQSNKVSDEVSAPVVAEKAPKAKVDAKQPLKNIKRLSEEDINKMPFENLREMAKVFGRDAYEYMVVVYRFKYPEQFQKFDWNALGRECEKKILSKENFTQEKMKGQAKTLFGDTEFIKAIREPFSHCKDILKKNNVPADQIRNLFAITEKDSFTFFASLKDEKVLKALRLKNPKSLFLNYNYSLLSAQKSIDKKTKSDESSN